MHIILKKICFYKENNFFSKRHKIHISDKYDKTEVIETLQRVKVYVDFGNHSGKNRLPREAIILGCCLITGKRESTAFFEDVPIHDEYKFEDIEENIFKIIEKIRDCFENFKERYGV
ncbi:hypothetical protein [Caldisericum exile]|uniref:hypothetical protein n=1 Tax=Caldisericum exile TaxID=693075 RepID=UPI003C786545